MCWADASKDCFVLFLFSDDISIVELLSKIIYAIAIFYNGKKNYNILDVDEDYIRINMNQDIKKQ